MDAMQLLIIDNGSEVSGWMASRLERQGFATMRALTLSRAYRNNLVDRCSAIIIDTGESADSLSQKIKHLRENNCGHPVMVISCQCDWADRVKLFDAGADDLLTRPVRVEEVASRLRAIVRRTAGGNRNILTMGQIQLDIESGAAWIANDELVLTRNEYRLLRLFMLKPDTLLSQQHICDQVYFDGKPRSDNAVEVMITRIRRKIGSGQIRTVRGLGYRFCSAAAVADDLVCEEA